MKVKVLFYLNERNLLPKKISEREAKKLFKQKKVKKQKWKILKEIEYKNGKPDMKVILKCELFLS